MNNQTITKNKKQKAAKANIGFQPIKGAKQITREFNTLWKDKGGPYHQECLWSSEAILATCWTNGFSFYDFILHSAAFDLDKNILQDYFFEWTKALTAGGAVKSCEGVYNYPIFSFEF